MPAGHRRRPSARKTAIAEFASRSEEHLSRAVVRFHVDVNVGDPIWPEPEQISLPRLIDGAISVRGYPLEMVLAEKIVTGVGARHGKYALARLC